MMSKNSASGEEGRGKHEFDCDVSSNRAIPAAVAWGLLNCNLMSSPSYEVVFLNNQMAWLKSL